jgi:lipopolysaccharide export system protein LptC
MPTDTLARARRVRFLTCDVDGVLTDGKIYVDDLGHEMKAFSALDGVGLSLLARAGIVVAWVTGSIAPAVTHRARRLNIAQWCSTRPTNWCVGNVARDLGFAPTHVRTSATISPTCRCFRTVLRRVPRAGRARARAHHGARRRRGRGTGSRSSFCGARPYVRRCRRALRRQGLQREPMAREIRARSILDRITAWSPVLLLGPRGVDLLARLASPAPASPRRLERHDPDIYVDGFRSVTLDEKGRPTQVIEGKRALHFGDDQTTEFTEPMLAQTEAETALPDHRGAWPAVRRPQGRRFHGQCARRPRCGPVRPANPAGPVTVTTEYLHVSRKGNSKHRQSGDDRGTRGIIHSVGLELDNKAKTLKLKSAVRGTLQPQALPK